ncbi:MAG: hypothetical protein MI921_09505 [Cytophagales bacterium]|nr:hypothetical protein [Cytophagales bacterium]
MSGGNACSCDDEHAFFFNTAIEKSDSLKQWIENDHLSGTGNVHAYAT